MKFMKDQLLTRLYGDDGSGKSSKFIRNIPNAYGYKLVIQGKDIPLSKHKIDKSITSHIEIISGGNKKANRYLNYQVNRLMKRPDNFGDIVFLLVKRSIVGYIAHLNRILPTGYRSTPIGYPLRTMKKVRQLVEDEKGDIEFYRVYIPKKTDEAGQVLTGRPLGVPTIPGRILLSMLNTALAIYLEKHGENSQHAYFPRKGTLTVGKEILKKIQSPNIYEFDLKQFFPNVEVDRVSTILKSIGMPMKGVYYFENLNLSKPILQEKDLVDESETREALDIQAGIINENQKGYQPLKEVLKCPEVKQWIIEETGGFSIGHKYEYVQLQAAMLASYNPEQSFHSTRKNLPQGGGISPILSVQVLKPLFEENPTAVMYADDGIIFDHPVLDSPKYEGSGIEFHPEKSKYVKKNGTGISPLKFCGLVYDGVTNTLRSETRKGRTLEIPIKKMDSILKDAWGYTEKSVPRETNIGLTTFESRIGGLIQSMLYNGTMELNNLGANGEVEKSRTCWLNSKAAQNRFKAAKQKPTLYNSSSMACNWLMDKYYEPKRKLKFKAH